MFCIASTEIHKNGQNLLKSDCIAPPLPAHPYAVNSLFVSEATSLVCQEQSSTVNDNRRGHCKLENVVPEIHVNIGRTHAREKNKPIYSGMRKVYLSIQRFTKGIAIPVGY